MIKSELARLGLSNAEAQIYESLLKLGSATVRNIAKDCGFHRTNIYDVLEKLKEKGLVTFFKEGKVVKYQATDPQNFYEFLQEKKEILDSIFPALLKLQTAAEDQIQVEVYKGEEGMKAVFRDMIRQGKNIYGFGIKGQLRERMPVFGKQIIQQLKKHKIKYYAIFTERGNLPDVYTEIRYVNPKFSSPVATFIYGNKINIQIWDPTIVAIVLKSEQIAKMYKNHFDILWNAAEK